MAYIDLKTASLTLIEMVKHDNQRLVELCLLGNANINFQDETGMTPLMWAVLKGNKEMVSLLLDAGALFGINIKDNNGHTAIEQARMKNASEMVQLLENAIEKSA